MRHVWVIGFMGAGKTTVGALLAQRLGSGFIDLDDVIERDAGRSVADLFARSGEAAFRALERDAVASVAKRAPLVISTGGGAVTDDASRAIMASTGTVLYLKVTAEEALSRVGDTADRPLLREDASGAAVRLLEARTALYETLADVVVDTVGLTAEQVAEAAARALGRADAEGGAA